MCSRKVIFLLVFFTLNLFSVSIYADKNSTYQGIYDYNNDDYESLNEEFRHYIEPVPELISDPFEPINRAIFNFNMTLDIVLFEPAVAVYNFVLPRPYHKYVNSFFTNLSTPVTFTNNILQGKFKEANVSFWRFIINSLFGFAGVADIASEMGLRSQREDFGQTLAKWDVPAGPYIMLPILGPTTSRGIIGNYLDLKVDLLNNNYCCKKSKKDSRFIKLLNVRSGTKQLMHTIRYDSLDPYVTMRSLYVQNRLSQIGK